MAKGFAGIAAPSVKAAPTAGPGSTAMAPTVVRKKKRAVMNAAAGVPMGGTKAYKDGGKVKGCIDSGRDKNDAVSKKNGGTIAKANGGSVQGCIAPGRNKNDLSRKSGGKKMC